MNLQDLSRQFVVEGRVESIFLRPARREPTQAVQEVRAEPGRGLIGDHRSDKERTGDRETKREVTLIQAEHLDLIARWSGRDAIDPSKLRRNLVVSGVNLWAMRSPLPDTVLEWALGDEVRIEVTGPCDPCSRMEEEIGTGGFNAMRQHGGVTARLLQGGTIRVGDAVRCCGVRDTDTAS